MGATQPAQPEASIPRTFAVGAVMVPPVASNKGRRYFEGTANPSSAPAGSEKSAGDAAEAFQGD